MNSAILIAAMSIVTVLIRFLPFWIFKNHTPRYISYLGRVLPPAIIGMLVVYCLKDIHVTVQPFGLPELIATGCVIAVQTWKRNALFSILSGTIIYMVLIRTVF